MIEGFVNTCINIASCVLYIVSLIVDGRNSGRQGYGGSHRHGRGGIIFIKVTSVSFQRIILCLSFSLITFA